MKRWEQPGFCSQLTLVQFSARGSGKRLHTQRVLLLFPSTSAILSHPKIQGGKFNLHRMPQVPISGTHQYYRHISCFLNNFSTLQLGGITKTAAQGCPVSFSNLCLPVCAFPPCCLLVSSSSTPSSHSTPWVYRCWWDNLTNKH